MEQEKQKLPHSADNTGDGTLCDCTEEVSYCNCENQEQLTAYQADDARYGCGCETPTNESVKTKLCNTASRIAEDFRECNGNPYLKDTCSYRMDIYKSPRDETPIDTFVIQKSKGFTLRSLAITLGAISLVALTVGFFKLAAQDK